MMEPSKGGTQGGDLAGAFMSNQPAAQGQSGALPAIMQPRPNPLPEIMQPQPPAPAQQPMQPAYSGPPPGGAYMQAAGTGPDLSHNQGQAMVPEIKGRDALNQAIWNNPLAGTWEQAFGKDKMESLYGPSPRTQPAQAQMQQPQAPQLSQAQLLARAMNQAAQRRG